MEYTLTIRKHFSRIYRSDIKEDVMDAFEDILENDVDGLAEAIEKWNSNLAQLLRTIINEHKNRYVLWEISEDLEKYADYSENELTLKEYEIRNGCIELTLPILIDLNCLEDTLEGIKAHSYFEDK